MLKFPNILLSLAFSFFLVGGASADEEVTTITETNYITPEWFQNAIQTALAAQASDIDSGIPIVFVNGDIDASPSANSAETIVTSTDLQYTVVTNSGTYTTSAPYHFTTTRNNNNEQDSEQSTEYVFDTETNNRNVFVQITRSAQTTTETVFEATETPTTTVQSLPSVETITTTFSNPLVTGSVVSKTNTRTINTDNFESAESITIANKAVEEESSSFADLTVSESPDDISFVTPALDSSSSAETVSTIDLRISSTSEVDLQQSTSGANFVAKKYSNASASDVLSSESSATENAETSLFESEASASLYEPSEVASTTKGLLSSSLVSSSTASSSSASSASSSVAAASATSVAKVPSGSGNLFEPISTEKPLSVFKREELPLSIPKGVDNDDVPYQTNKFFTNFILDNKTDMVWSYPYGMFWKTTDYYGLGVQHTNASNRVFGPTNENNSGKSYFMNPSMNAELLISSTSMSKNKNFMKVSDMKTMSTKVTLSASESSSDNIEIPIVQGMGFVSAIYNGDMTPMLNTLIGVKSLSKESSDAMPENSLKYRATLFNGIEYLIYVTLPDADEASDFKLSAEDSFHIEGSHSVDGLVIQLAVAPSDSSDDGYYDEAAGMYPVSATIEGSSSGTSATYSFDYKTEGKSSSGKTMVFALPHHVESLTGDTADSKTPIKLESTTKGEMVGLLSNKIELSETLNTNVQFLPWAPVMKDNLQYSKDQLKLLAKTAQDELNVDIKLTVAGMDSNYFSGKVIDKYAQILLVIHDILGDDDYAEGVLEDLKDAFKDFIDNKQYYPLMYDTKFKGVTSTASQDGDTGADFGSAYYNDHHFHYGYFIHAAAVVGYVDSELGGSWAEDNKDWVNNLIRDVANPSEDDSYFPVSRMFDWFAGHSWAGGLFASGDGRNEESSSEDYHFSYGMKLWGKVVGDSSMEARGDLMLAVMKRAMNKYFYFKDDNDVVPKEMLPNKVTGILFDNKIAFTTYFGDANDYPQYVHGIHMIPMTAAAALIRTEDYVEQEWKQAISSFIDNVDDGWSGILRLNQALFDPESSYEFFSDDDFKSTYLDNGQSRTWSLAFAGGLSA